MRLKSIKAICLISVLCLLASGCSSKSTNINTKETNSITAEKNKRRNKDAKPGVEFSAPSGIYDAEFDVTISATDGGTIFYTLDGSDPACSKSAMPYTGNIKITDRTGAANIVSAVDPVLISGNFNKVNSTKDGFTCDKVAPQDSAVDKCTVIRANVKYEDDTWGIEGSETYFVGSMQDHIPGYKESLSDFNEKLAVISLSVNYDDLFDYETGIYVKGKTFDEDLENYLKNDQLWDGETARGLEANYKMRGKEWERECNMTMMELSSDGSLSSVLNQNCGIRIQGNYSRSDLQKGFRLYAREEYGDNKFRYDVFGGKCTDNVGRPMDKFKHLVLRAGGNCAFNCKFNDTYWQSLIGSLDVTAKVSRPCVVYLNGEYWGVYVLEEDFNDDYFKDHYAVSEDDVILYKGDAEKYASGYRIDIGDIPENENENYYFKELSQLLYDYKTGLDDDGYKELCKLVDSDSFCDYFAVESFINNKWDWPGKNWSMWKTKNVDSKNFYGDGRWRLCVYDVEFGGISGKDDAYTNTIKEDNYKPKGLLDMSTNNIPVKTFAVLMTNKQFREKFYDRLSGLSEGVFAKDVLNSRLDEFESAYIPLLDQFFERYPGCGSSDDAVNGGYASVSCLRDFIDERENHIQTMIDYCDSVLE